MSSLFPGFIIRSTSIAVDYWPKNHPDITHYFLTHAHSDHTKGLNSDWNGPVFYCSSTTKKLIVNLLKIRPEFVKELEMNQGHIMKLDANETFTVTLIDANHCYGGVMFLFEGYFGSILATGDFRYSPQMFIETPLGKSKIEICYLDNTYFNSDFQKIPSREEAVEEIIQVIDIKRKKFPKLKFAIIMKNLGKENMLIKLADYFKTKILISTERFERYCDSLQINPIYFATELTDDLFLITDDNDFKACSFFPKKNIFYIKPTALGYSYKLRPRNSLDWYSNLNSYCEIPFTDHSSYDEITEFIKKLQPKLIIPIVNPIKEKREIINNDIHDLLKYCNPELLIDSSLKFKMLLESKTSIRHSRTFKMPLNMTVQPITDESIHTRLRSRVYKPRTDYFLLKKVPRRKPVTRIEYESSPEKDQPKQIEEMKLRSTKLDLKGQQINSENKEANANNLNYISSSINLNLSNSETNNNNNICTVNIDSRKWSKLNQQVEILERIVLEEKASDKRSNSNNRIEKTINDASPLIKDTSLDSSSSDGSIITEDSQPNKENRIATSEIIMITEDKNETNKDKLIGSEQVNKEASMHVSSTETDTFYSDFKSKIISSISFNNHNQSEMSLNNKMLNFLKNNQKY